jgi:outer membrane protein TolC
MKSAIALRWFQQLWRGFLLVGLAGAFSLALRAGEVDPHRKEAEKVLHLEWVLGEVRTNNPTLKAARAIWEARNARVARARASELLAPHPEHNGDRSNGGDTPDPGVTLGELRIALAESEAAIARAEWRRRELDLLGAARAAFFRYANALAQLELNRQHEQLFSECLRATRHQYAVGIRTQTDVLLAESGLAAVLERRAEIERQISEEQSRINVLMNRPAFNAVPPPQISIFRPIVLNRFRQPPGPHAEGEESQFEFNWPLFEQRMQSLASKHRPELEMAAAKIHAARARLALARLGGFSSVTLRIEPALSGGSIEGFEPGLLWHMNSARSKALIEEAAKMLEAAEHESGAAGMETTGLVRNQVKKIETVQVHYLFVRDRMLPLARQTLEAVQHSYLSGRGHFPEVLTAQRAVWENESRLEQHLADYLSGIAELEALAGANVEMDQE